MVSNTAFSKIGKIDFFAVLPAGFYTLSVTIFVSVCHFDSCGNSDIPLWCAAQELFKFIQEQPYSLLYLFFVSYLLGIVFRVLPVNWAEILYRLIHRFCCNLFKYPYQKPVGYGESFPYMTMLKNTFDQLNQNDWFKCQPFRLQLQESFDVTAFNYIKDYLRAKDSDAYSYYESFEARSRFFASMFWAGAAGTVGSLFLLFNGFSINLHATWLLLPSVVIMFVYSISLKKVRELEAKVLLFTYIAHKQPVEKLNADDPSSSSGLKALLI